MSNNSERHIPSSLLDREVSATASEESDRFVAASVHTVPNEQQVSRKALHFSACDEEVVGASELHQHQQQASE